ncbi:MAG: hypothetical protein AB2L26_07775 [Ignavibacteria bacterium]
MGGYNSAAPYDFYDHFNQIGVGGGNTIRLFGGGSSTSYGIYTIYQDSLAVSNNDIGGGAGGHINKLWYDAFHVHKLKRDCL